MVAARQKYYYTKMYNFYKTIEEKWTLRCLNELNSRERERERRALYRLSKCHFYT